MRRSSARPTRPSRDAELSSRQRQACARREAAFGRTGKGELRNFALWPKATTPSAIRPTIIASSRTSCACAMYRHRHARPHLFRCVCSMATARRAWSAIWHGATREPACCPTLARISSIPPCSGSANRRRISAVFRPVLRKPGLRSRQLRLETDRRSWKWTHAAQLAQSLLRRRVRRERQRSHPVAVQVGAEQLHAAPPRPAKRPPG